MICSVYGCKSKNCGKQSTTKTDIHFFTFPKDKPLQKLWVSLCGRQDKFNVKNGRICSMHFKPEDFKPSQKDFLAKYGIHIKHTFLLKGAVPSKHLPRTYGPEETPCTKARDARVKKRAARSEPVPDVPSAVDPIGLEIEIKEEIIEDTESRTAISHSQPVTCFMCGAESPFEYVTDVEYRQIQEAHNTAIKEINELKLRVLELDKQNSNLSQQNADLKLKIDEMESNRLKNTNVKKSFYLVFNTGHVRRPQKSTTSQRWPLANVANGITVHSSGTQSYRLFRRKKCPLPTASSLRRWWGKDSISPKPIQPAIKNADVTINIVEPVHSCTLSSDDKKKEQPFLCDNVDDQLAMIRGLFENCKHPIFVDYECRMDKAKLDHIISRVERTGFKVVAIVCDLSRSNRALQTEIGNGTSSKHTWFPNPTDAERNVFTVFADVPQLIKLISNIQSSKKVHLRPTASLILLSSGPNLSKPMGDKSNSPPTT